MRGAALTAFVVVTCGVAGGCGGAPTPVSVKPSPLATAQARHEYPAPVSRQQAAAGFRSPVEAVDAFASAYINWTAQSVATHMRRLAELSIGQARSAAQLAASETAGDYELRRGGIANSGQVEAVAPLRGSPRRYVVVTRELTTASATTAYQGLAPAWHLSLATVAEVAAGAWVVTGWQPEN